MGALNGFPVSIGDGGIGYFAPGATDDWLYGTRGVPSYTFEIGPDSGPCAGFFLAYSCMAATFWPQQEPALLYAAQSAATRYGSLTLGVQRGLGGREQPGDRLPNNTCAHSSRRGTVTDRTCERMGATPGPAPHGKPPNQPTSAPPRARGTDQ